MGMYLIITHNEKLIGQIVTGLIKYVTIVSKASIHSVTSLEKWIISMQWTDWFI